jgi:UDP-glucuronate 4-epimerase
MYAVTGGAGFVGSHLVEALQRTGHAIRAVDALTDHYDPELKRVNAAGLDLLQLDLADDPLDTVLKDVDGIFHLAAKPGVRSGWGRDFSEYVHDNVMATQRLFDAAAAAGVRVVFASSSSIYGEAATYPTPEDVTPCPISPYGVTKLSCEHLAHSYAKNYGLEVVTLRLFTVYGPRQRPDMAFSRLVTALAESRPFGLYGDGSQSRGFTYVSDAVGAFLVAMERAPAGAVYNVGGGSEATMREVIELLEGIAGRKLDLSIGERAAGDVARTAADTTRIHKQIGWEPRMSLRDGLAAQWDWATAEIPAS